MKKSKEESNYDTLLNTLANLIQQYIWLAIGSGTAGRSWRLLLPHARYPVFLMVIAYIGGSAKNDTKRRFAFVLDHGGRVCVIDVFDLWFTGTGAGTLSREIGACGMHPWEPIMVLMALQIWGWIRILPIIHMINGTEKATGNMAVNAMDHHHHHEEEHHHPGLSGGDGQCHCASESNKKGYLGALLAEWWRERWLHCSTPVMIALLAMAAQAVDGSNCRSSSPVQCKRFQIKTGNFP